MCEYFFRSNFFFLPAFRWLSMGLFSINTENIFAQTYFFLCTREWGAPSRSIAMLNIIVDCYVLVTAQNNWRREGSPFYRRQQRHLKNIDVCQKNNDSRILLAATWKYSLDHTQSNIKYIMDVNEWKYWYFCDSLLIALMETNVCRNVFTECVLAIHKWILAKFCKKKKEQQHWKSQIKMNFFVYIIMCSYKNRIHATWFALCLINTVTSTIFNENVHK